MRRRLDGRILPVSAAIVLIAAAASLVLATRGPTTRHGTPAGASPVQRSTELPWQEQRFRITLSAEAAAGIDALGLDVPVTGRVYVILSRSNEREPRLQTGLTGVPLWGMDVSGLSPGDSVILDPADDAVFGYPFELFPNLGEIGTGEYHLQAFLNVYTTFERSDGHTLLMHLNSGAGQSVFRAPGNAHSEVSNLMVVSTGMPPVEAKPSQAEPEPPTIDFEITEVIPPIDPLRPGEVLQQGNPRDSARVKFVKIRSEVLSAFWGRDMYIGANVLLPAGYDDDPDTRYPTIYAQGHFPGGNAPFGYREPGDHPPGGAQGRSAGVREFWLSDDAPRMIAVSIRDANPYYDTSYSVNSANVGPYGDAIHDELIPYLEESFPMIPETWARVLAGGSTGGWEALAMQIFYPEVYGGTWGWCPDPVDFNYYQIVNIYEDANAYWTEYDWMRVERPNARRADGNVRSTVRMENWYEHAVGPDSRSGGQWAIWEAVYGPVGPNGYPSRIWDPITGEIDSSVARYWLENFDLHQHLRENWSEIGPSLRGKLHIATGEMDTYYLEQAVYLLEEFLSTVDDPPADATIEYGDRKPHCWIGYSPERAGEDLSNVEFLRIAADHMRANQPADSPHAGWYR